MTEKMTEKKVKASEDLFTKEQIVASKRFARYADFLTGVLSDENMYTLAEVAGVIYENYKEKI